jgi:hypothetical protein
MKYGDLELWSIVSLHGILWMSNLALTFAFVLGRNFIVYEYVHFEPTAQESFIIP